jgi:uncharacterized membrane protein
MTTSQVSSPIRNRIRLLTMLAVSCSLLAFCAIVLHAGSSPQSPQQVSAALSRSGWQTGQPHSFSPSRVSTEAAENSPLYTYTFGLIDYPRSNVSGIWGINDHGKMVGGYNNTNMELYSADHGYELRGNNFFTINYPGAMQTDLFSINKSGEIVGAFGNSQTDCCHGFKLVSGTYTQLDCPGSNFTVALGVNNSGDIVGMCADPKTGNATGYLLSGGVYTSIIVPGAIYTYTEGINNAGVIAGYYFDTGHNSHGFTWNKGTITTIDYGNGYPNTYLAGINDTGVIVGGYGTNMTIGSIVYPWEHGFLYSSGTFSTFDAPFGDVQVTQPWGMNNKGEIVGGYVDSQGMLYGFYAKATP